MSIRVLNSVRIFELGQHPSVRAAGRLLAECGAEVVRLGDGSVERFFDAGKTVAASEGLPAASEISELLRGANVVITDEMILREFLPPQDFPLACDAWCKAHAGTVLVVLTSERGGNVSKSWALTEMGARHGAGLDASLVPLNRAEEFPFAVATTFAAYFLALSATLGLVKRERTGTATWSEVPMWEAALAAQGLQAVFSGPQVPRWSPLQWLASPFKGIWRAADGAYLYMHIGLTHHLARFIDVLGKVGMAKDAATLRRRLHKKTVADPVAIKKFSEGLYAQNFLRKLFLRKTAQEWEQVMGQNGLCAAKLRTYDEWLAHPHAVASGIVQEIFDDSGHVRRVPGRFLRFGGGLLHPLAQAHVHRTGSVLKRWHSAGKTQSKNRGPAADSLSPLAGLRVLDFSQVIAGPLVGRTLAEFGAEVIRIENPTVDQGFVEPFAAGYQAGKASIRFDLRKSDALAALWKFVAEFKPDVVLQNFSPGVAEKIGISEADFRKNFPHIVFADLTAFGHGGPLAKQPGFEQTAQALTGMMCDYPKGDEPRMFPLAVNDIGAGLLGTVGVVAAYFHTLRSEGSGQRVHTSLAAAATFLQAVTRAHGRLGEPVGRRTTQLKKLLQNLDSKGSSAIEMRMVSEVGPVALLRSPVYFPGPRISLTEAESAAREKWLSDSTLPTRPKFRKRVYARYLLREAKWALWLGFTRVLRMR